MRDFMKMFMAAVVVFSLWSFNSTSKPYLVSVEKVRITTAADMQTIPATVADLLVVVDRATAIASGTMPLPANPIDGQIFILATRVDITALTLDGGSHPISGGVTTIKGGDSKAWFYDLTSDRWFRYLSDQTEATAGLALKLDINGNGSSLTGLTVAQVNPTSIGVPVWARVSGSDATTTGQALTDVTGLSITLTTSATYEVEAALWVTTSAVTTGTQYGVNYTAAGSTWKGGLAGSSSTTAMKGEQIALNTASTTFLATSAQSGIIIIKGTIITGANAGDFRIRHLKVTSGTSTVQINSSLKVTRIQ